MNKHKQKIKIVHKNGVTHIYDADGQDLTKQLTIVGMDVKFDVGERREYPEIILTILGQDMDIEIDNANMEIKCE